MTLIDRTSKIEFLNLISRAPDHTLNSVRSILFTEKVYLETIDLREDVVLAIPKKALTIEMCEKMVTKYP